MHACDAGLENAGDEIHIWEIHAWEMHVWEMHAWEICNISMTKCIAMAF